MSILLNALNKAAADREAARQAGGGGSADFTRAQADAQSSTAPVPGKDNTRTQTDADDAMRATHRIAPDSFGGLWITMALAIACAATFGFWMKGLSSVKVLPVPVGSILGPAPPVDAVLVSGATPAVLQMHEAGPLQLRLDRQLQTPAAGSHK